jgi:hypothetical protein
MSRLEALPEKGYHENSLFRHELGINALGQKPPGACSFREKRQRTPLQVLPHQGVENGIKPGNSLSKLAG